MRIAVVTQWFPPEPCQLPATIADVRPGITGLAQISGRNALSWDEKFRLDVEYVDHHTFVGDLKILPGTVSSGARREGISEAGETTSSEFLGTDEPGTDVHEEIA